MRIISIALLAMFTVATGCSSLQSVPVNTPASNQHEKALQRIILPGVCRFDERPVHPKDVLLWVAGEAAARDGHTPPVQFDIRLADAPDAADARDFQKEFRYKSTAAEDRIRLPDAVKVYASILGLGYKFEENRVVIHMVE